MENAVPRAVAWWLRAPPLVLLATFSAACAAGQASGYAAPHLVALAAAAGLGAVLALRARRAALALAALLVVVGAAGLLWGQHRAATTAPVALGLPAAIGASVVIDTPPVPTARGGWRARGVVEQGHIGGRPARAGVRLLLALPDGEPPPTGTRLRVHGWLRPAAEADSPGWWRRWLERQGIAARITVARPVPAGRRGGAAGLRDRWRQWAWSQAGRGVGGDAGALVRGMALGGGAQLSESTATAFRDSGLWHLLAVSGQNVTVVALAMLALLRAVGVGRRPAVVGAMALLVAYCLACDGGASVARAGTVGALGLAGELVSAPRQRWALLLAGLAGLVAWQPRAIADPGLQLSFAAVMGIFVIAPPLQRWLGRVMPGPIATLVAMSAGAGVATAPVVIATFGRLSLVGSLANVVAVPVAGPVVVAALAGIALGAVLPAAGVVAAHVAAAGATLVLAVARLAAAVPGAAVELPRGGAILWSLALLGTLTAGALAGWARAAPGATPTPATRAALPALVAVVALVATAWLLWPRPQSWPWPTTAAITMLDVGQGDALLLRDGAGTAVLVDTGPPGDRPAVLRGLTRAGVADLAAVIVTHGDADHAGGLEGVIGRHRVGAIIHPPHPSDGPGRHLATGLAAAGRRAVPVHRLSAGHSLAVGGWRLRVLGPPDPLPAGTTANDGSLVIEAEAPGLRVLLTGDAESPRLTPLSPRPVDVLKVSHHGSADPGLTPLLARLTPAVALISVGRGNRFGHPDPGVIGALEGTLVGRSDRDGAVTVAAGAAGPHMWREG